MSYPPEGESADLLWLERSNFVGGFLGAIAYGIHALLFAMTVRKLLTRHTGGRSRKRILLFICLLFIGATLNLATGIRWNQMIWIDDRGYPGGPIAFVSEQFSNWVNVFSSAAYLFVNILSDGLVLYRCLMIWNFNYLVIVLPILTYLGMIAMGILLLYQTAQPMANLWTTLAVNVGIPYWSLSVSLNVLATLLITARLLSMRNRLRASLGPHHAAKYTGIIALVVESAALYSGFGLIFIITYARNSYVQNLILPMMAQIMCIAPLMILYRVASGKAFDSHVSKNISAGTSMSFARPPPPSGGSTTRFNNSTGQWSAAKKSDVYDTESQPTTGEDMFEPRKSGTGVAV